MESYGIAILHNDVATSIMTLFTELYCKWGKICWAKLSHFLQFSGVQQKIFREYKCLSLIILNNEYLWPSQRKNISAKTLIALKL